MSFLDKILNNNKEEEEKSDNGFFFSKKKKDSKIEDLIKNNDIESLKEQITSSNVNEKENNSTYPLHYAVIHNNKEAVDYLFSIGAKVETAKKDVTDNVLKILIEQNNHNILQAFINQKIVIPRLILATPIIHYSLIKKVSFDFFKTLIENKVQLEEHEEQSALQKALEVNSEIEIIKYLIKLDTQNIHIFNKKKNILEEIILSPMDNLKKTELIKFIKEHTNISLNQKTKDEEQTILELVINLKQTMVAKEMILLGVDFSKIKYQLNTIFEKGDLEEIINIIISRQLNLVDYCFMLSYEKINDYFTNCDTLKNTLAILNVVENPKLLNEQKIELINLAIKKDANINEVDIQNNTTALLNYSKIIRENTPTDLLKLLLEYGAKIEICEQSALFYSIKSNNLDIFNLFIEYKADVNFLTNEGKSLANFIIEDEIIGNKEDYIIEILKICMKNNLNFNIKSTILIDEEPTQIDMFSMFLYKVKEKVIDFLLNKNIELDKDNDFVFYAIKYLIKANLQKRVIDLNPTYEYKDFFMINYKRDNAQALGIAISFAKEKLISLLVDTYPNMKSHCEIKEIYLDLVEKNFDLEVIKKLILTDSNINREYDDNGIYTYTILLKCAKRINDEKYNKTQKYIELFEFLLQNGADINIQQIYHDEKIDSSTIFSLLANEKKVNEEVFNLLFKYGARLDDKTSVFKENIIQNIINKNADHMSDDVIISYLEYFDEKMKIDLEDTNLDGMTLLLTACFACKPKTVEWLIQKGADITVKGGKLNANVLYMTICSNRHVKAIDRLETLKVLINNNADIEELSNNLTALMASCFYGTYICTEYLLENNAKVNAKNKDNITALNYTIQGDTAYDSPFSVESVKTRTIQLLHKYGADLDNIPDTRDSALVTSILDNKREIFECLLDLKVDVNKKDINGMTPLMFAVVQGHIYFINKLLEEPTLKINEVDTYNANALYFTLYRNNKNEAVSIFDKLVAKQIEESVIEDGVTLLHKACEIGNFELIPSILSFTKYDINVLDDFGATPVLMLILSNYNMNEFLKIKILKYLVEKGANINIIDKEDNHILNSSILLKEKNLTQTILELGADTSITTSEGKNAYHILLEQDYSINELTFYFDLFSKYNIDINYNKNIDSPLLSFTKSMEFSTGRSVGFVAEKIEIKEEEDKIVELLIKYGANLQMTIEEAIKKEESKDIIDYLKKKEN
ncbi:MAG: ankyrin repeat domain-containing protein [Campylobacteraceae bacterium]|nr:ankyrin repeat domain-containing protein [Campylobacteraceae bacterium]